MNNQTVALKLLKSHSAGLTTAEIVRLSGGEIGWDRAYVLMERLADMGYTEDENVPATDDYPIAQTRYTLSSEGRRALRAAGSSDRARSPRGRANAGSAAQSAAH